MRVLVTRPAPAAQALAETLRHIGHEPVVAPLFTIEPSDHPLSDDWRARILLLTSANGARMAGARGLSGRCYAVGAATAEAARRAGLSIAGIAEGDAAALAALVARQLPAGTRLLHISGADTAGDLCGALAKMGFDVRRFIAYRAAAASALPAAAGDFLRGTPGAALLYSPRAASTLAGLVTAAGLERAVATHRALALSVSVAKEAGRLPWRAIETAAHPDQRELLRLL